MAHALNAISVSGNLLSNEFLHTSTQPGGKFQAFDPSTFDPSWKREADFEAALSRAWEDLKDRFDEIYPSLPYMDLPAVRRGWTLPLLRTLGFAPAYQKARLKLPRLSETFPISHRGWGTDDAPVMHLLSPQSDLDSKPAERGAKSPQMMVQTFLNQDSTQSWGILSNGAVLRLLRVYHHTSQAGYVQFDLVQLFLTRDYDEFRSLYRLAHASRFVPRGTTLVEAKAESEDKLEDEGEDENAPAEAKRLPVWLEVCYEHARSEGSRAEASLRKNVMEALIVLGNGLLTPGLRQRLIERPADMDIYYRQLLRVVYRCIFLLFAEQRGLIRTDSPFAEVYHDEYSLTALRNLAEEQRLVRDHGSDLWERLLLTFELARVGNEDLGVQAFNGDLFDAENLYLVYGNVFDPALRNTRDDLPRLTNQETLRFIECLGFTTVNGTLERINYRDLKVEEIGHIYEGLLDFAPHLAAQDLMSESGPVAKGAFYLDERSTSRKTSGSYYTPKELVQEIISRALLPVIDERLAAADNTLQAQEEALLSIKVLDPACGSGAFLIAANDALAKRLADLRWQAAREEALRSAADTFLFEGRVGASAANPSQTHERYYEEVQKAKRDVLASCIYGVDLNDMAVELAKVSLWIDAASSGKPLNFLDHRIRCGNSLLGAPLNFIYLGINPDAYKGRGDADKDTLAEVRKVFSPKQYAERHKRLDEEGALFDLKIQLPDLGAVREDSVEGVREKEERYERLRAQDALAKWQLVADYWTSAFFYPVKPNTGTIPNQKSLNLIVQALEERTTDQLKQLTPLSPQVLGHIAALKHQYNFFHYWLEFPEAFFDSAGNLKAQRGFDVIVGNPPWEVVQPEEKKWFAGRNEEIAEASGAKRKKLIKKLETEDLDLYEKWNEHATETHATANFVKASGRYPTLNTGKVNLYAVFAAGNKDLTSSTGRTGIIVPSGIATDNTTKDLFRDFVESQSLVSLDDFENREKLFVGVDSRMKFCLLVLTAPGSGPEEAQFSFFNTNVKHLSDLSRHFTLSAEDFKRINPNTLTCPTFRTGRDAEITLKMYKRAGVFIDENDEENGNPWGASFMQMFNMTSDSSLFRTREELEAEGLTLTGNRFVRGEEVYLPLYEGKMAHIYDHHFAFFDSYEGEYQSYDEKNATAPLTTQFYVHHNEVKERVSRRKWERKWFFGVRRVTRSNDTRTVIGSFVPYCAITYGLYVLFSPVSLLNYIALVANLNSITFDYHARNALSQPSLTYGVLYQLPNVKITKYSKENLHFILPRVLELTYTAWDIKPFADDLWREAGEEVRGLFREAWRANAAASGGGHATQPPAWAEVDAEVDAAGCPLAPFTWNEARRAELRSELDALYAHLYGLTREELAWILDPRDIDPATPSVSFPGLRRSEEKRYGEYRTKRLVLEYFDRLAEAREGVEV